MAFLADFDVIKSLQHELSEIDRSATHLLQSWLQTKFGSLFDELRAHRPILNAPGIVLVSKYADVMEVLSHDEVFSVQPYRPKIERIGGPFVLGLPNGPQYQHDDTILKASIKREDLATIRQIAAATASQNIERARPQVRINVVNSLSRAVPLAVVSQYFGIPGPDDATILRWGRTIFDDIFANLQDDGGIKAAALDSGTEMVVYLDKLIALRHQEIAAGGATEDNLLNRQLRMQSDPTTSFDDVGVRNNFIGNIIGAFDTTSKAIVNVIVELLKRPVQLAGAKQAALDGNDSLLSAYINETLRFNPQNSFLVRKCEQAYTIATDTQRATLVEPGTLVFAANSSAMLDEDVIEAPQEFRLNRPASAYLHYGTGLHTCFGEKLSFTQILEVTKQLVQLEGLRFAPAPNNEVRYEGIYPDSFVVEFD